MKVLFLAPYIYEKSLPQFCKNKTGFGMMVNDIIKYVSEKNDVYLLTHTITKREKCNNITIVKHLWCDVLGSVSYKYLFRGLKYSLKFKQNLNGRLRYIFYYMDAGYVKNIIKEVNPDIVHIHSIGYSTKAYMDICEELKIPFIVTLHGLIGLGENILCTQQDKKFEKIFLQKSEKENLPVTVISRGIKKRILCNYGLGNGKNIRIITNGTNTEINDSIKIDIRTKYKIPRNNNIILCIGNISENKNQVQVIKAFSKITKKIQENTNILFLGNDMLNDGFQDIICELGYKKNLIHCGFVDRINVSSYLTQATLNVVASLDEGFGLSIVEGFTYGVPTVTFSDLDAVEDLFDANAMMLVNERSDEALAEGIEKALEFDWDREWIRNYGKQFSLERMAEEYHKLYLEVRKKR